MTRLMIRLDGEITEELTSAFPHMATATHRVQTTLTGEVADQEELQGILNLLHSLGVTVVELVTIP